MIANADGDRKKSFRGDWQDEWERFFAPEHRAGKAEIEETYEALMKEFRACIGLRVQ